MPPKKKGGAKKAQQEAKAQPTTARLRTRRQTKQQELEIQKGLAEVNEDVDSSKTEKIPVPEPVIEDANLEKLENSAQKCEESSQTASEEIEDTVEIIMVEEDKDFPMISQTAESVAVETPICEPIEQEMEEEATTECVIPEAVEDKCEKISVDLVKSEEVESKPILENIEEKIPEEVSKEEPPEPMEVEMEKSVEVKSEEILPKSSVEPKLEPIDVEPVQPDLEKSKTDFKFEKFGTEENVNEINVAIEQIKLDETKAEQKQIALIKEEISESEKSSSLPEQPEKKSPDDKNKDDEEHNDDEPNIRRSSRIKTISKTKQKSRGHGLVRDKDKLKLEESEKEDDKKDGPMKMKQRWLMEMQDNNNGENSEHIPDSESNSKSDNSDPKTAEVDEQVEERLRQFVTIKENIYHCEKNISKEAKKMVCDCFLTSEEKESGELGCGEDCLNRLLMIECGSRCVVGDRCTNRRFQKFQYAGCKVVRTEKKGFGIMATRPIHPGEFIMEYIGEVLNAKQFDKRAKAYSKEKNKHYYFMALRSDAVIDATTKGNISRFINHSCDPNAETQKWTVNGELRIGFFSKKLILTDEEITFDYQYQRYGKEAQKCFCESENCRGWIGEEPQSESDADDEESELGEEEDEDESSSVSSAEEEKPKPVLDTSKIEEKPVKERKKRVPKEPKPKPVKERKATVRRRPYRKRRQEILDDLDLDAEIANLLENGLKNQAHTLKLSRLFVRAKLPETRSRLLTLLRRGEMPCRRLFLDYHGLRLIHGWMNEDSGLPFRKEILETLENLPIPNKTMLKDSNVLTTVASWGDIQMDGEMKEIVDAKASPDEKSSPNELEEVKQEINSLAKQLISRWIQLPEVFRIPKKERIEQMKEHEREADMRYMALGLHNEEDNQTESNRYKNPKKPEEVPKKEFKWKDPNRVNKVDSMSKNQRRRLFAMQAEEELREKKRLDAWTFHEFRCSFFGLDPFRVRPEDVPSWVDLETGQWFSYDLTEVQTPANYRHIAIRPKEPSPANPDDYVLPEMDLPEGWEYALDTKGRLYYYHKKIRIPQWEQPIKILPLSEGVKKETVPEAMQVIDTAYEGSTNRDSSTTDTCDSSEEELVRKINRIKKLQKIGVPHSTIVKLNLHERNSDDETTKEEVGKAELRLTGQKMPNRESLVEFREISPRREEDRLYGQMEMKRYKETKEKFRRRKEMLKRRKLDRLMKSGLITADPDRRISFRNIQITNDELYDETEDEEDGDLVNGEGGENKKNENDLEDKQNSSKSLEDGTSTFLSNPLIEKIVLGNSRVDELDEPLKYNEMTKLKLREKNAKRKRALKVQMKLKKLKAREEMNGVTPSPKHQDHHHHHHPNGLTTTPPQTPLSTTQVKRIKDKFRTNIAGVIVQHLSPYRKDNCKVGRITSNDDFKHLARKLTHFVLLKELKQVSQVSDLNVTESVKIKSREFIKKYMTKYGTVYQRPENEPDYKD